MDVTTRISYFLWALISIAVLTDCEGAKQYYKESAVSYPTLESLSTDTDNKGLLLVDATGQGPSTRYALSGVGIVRTDNPKDTLLAGSFKTGGPLSPESGIVVFSNLKPGEYRIVKISLWSATRRETAYMPSTPEYLINIKTGQPIYFGRITVKQKGGFPKKNTIKVKYSNLKELKAWKKLLKKFPDSTWTPLINERIKSL